LVCELVSSRNHVQGSSCSGASLPVQQLSLIERTFCPLAVAGTTTHRPRPAATIIPPRLRGFAPHEAALPQFGVNRPTARSPPRFASPPGAPPLHPVLRFPRRNPLMTLPAEVFAHTMTSPSRLQRIPGEWLACLSPDCRPARDFRAFRSAQPKRQN
jgi:hypothetical protein